MPERIIAFMDNLLAVVMTVIPLLAWFVLNYLGGIISILIFIVYWIPKIKKERVDLEYGGSWIAWLKGVGNIFKKK